MRDVPQPVFAPSLAYRNRPGLVGLVLKNLLLNVLTLWIYRFWAKAAWRRHIWSGVSLLGDPLEYTGTGPEKFKGFLVALAFLAPFFIVFGIWEAMVAGSDIGTTIERVVYFAVLYALIVAASFYARRYRLSRTRWRGVALTLDAKFADYIKFYLRTQALNALTLFVMTPRASLAIEAWLIERTRFGAVNFVCEPDWRPIMKHWIVFASIGGTSLVSGLGWLGGVAPDEYGGFGVPPIHGGVFAVSVFFALPAYVYYRVALLRATVAGTTLGTTGFSSDARAAPIATYLVAGVATWLASVALAVGLIGVLGPAATILVFVCAIVGVALIRDAWIAPWIVDHVVNSLTVAEPDVLDTIAAGTEDALTRGEGLADSFDVGIG